MMTWKTLLLSFTLLFTLVLGATDEECEAAAFAWIRGLILRTNTTIAPVIFWGDDSLDQSIATFDKLNRIVVLSVELKTAEDKFSSIGLDFNKGVHYRAMAAVANVTTECGAPKEEVDLEYAQKINLVEDTYRAKIEGDKKLGIRRVPGANGVIVMRSALEKRSTDCCDKLNCGGNGDCSYMSTSAMSCTCQSNRLSDDCDYEVNMPTVNPGIFIHQWACFVPK